MTSNNLKNIDKISWKPLKKEQTALTNMVLKSIEGSLEFHLTIFARLPYFLLILLGAILLIYGTYALLSYHFQATLWSVLLGFSLTGIGIYFFSKQALPHIFDKEKNLYFKENENLEKEDVTPLSDIEALQLISYLQEINGRVEKQAELNLILKSGERLYVCSYNSDEYQRAKEDVKKIAQYIEKPILDREINNTNQANSVDSTKL